MSAPFIQPNSVQANFVQPGVAPAGQLYQCNLYQQNLYQNNCAPPVPVVTPNSGGLFLDPPPGWHAIDPEPRKRRHTEQYYGPLRAERGPLYPVDDLDELWLLGLTDLETN